MGPCQGSREQEPLTLASDCSEVRLQAVFGALGSEQGLRALAGFWLPPTSDLEWLRWCCRLPHRELPAPWGMEPGAHSGCQVSRSLSGGRGRGSPGKTGSHRKCPSDVRRRGWWEVSLPCFCVLPDFVSLSVHVDFPWVRVSPRFYCKVNFWHFCCWCMCLCSSSDAQLLSPDPCTLNCSWRVAECGLWDSRRWARRGRQTHPSHSGLQEPAWLCGVSSAHSSCRSESV